MQHPIGVFSLIATVLALLLSFQPTAARDSTIVAPKEARLWAGKLARTGKLIKKIISQGKLGRLSREAVKN